MLELDNAVGTLVRDRAVGAARVDSLGLGEQQLVDAAYGACSGRNALAERPPRRFPTWAARACGHAYAALIGAICYFEVPLFESGGGSPFTRWHGFPHACAAARLRLRPVRVWGPFRPLLLRPHEQVAVATLDMARAALVHGLSGLRPYVTSLGAPLDEVMESAPLALLTRADVPASIKWLQVREHDWELD